MKLILILFLAFSINGVAQIENYFSGDKTYTYNTTYIDSAGDTIIKGQLKICPSNIKWFFQPGKQKEIVYQYTSDSVSDNNYIDPEPFFAKKYKRRIQKKGYIGFSEEEVTGGFVTDSLFYMHPPRTNQFRRLFYAPHPIFEFEAYNKQQHIYTNKLTIYGYGVYNHKYICTKSATVKLFNDSIKTWDVYVDSNFDFKRERYEVYKDDYNSTLKAKFCQEYGFISLHYRFDNNIEIKFDLVIVETI